MASVTIRPVRSKRELKRFVKVPFRLHQGNPRWVAPLIFERMQFLDRARNPYFEHAEAEYFLAERDGEPVGRITAQVDERWDEYQGGSDAMFGFFETANDPEVAAALLGAAGEWAAGKGRSRILGPMDFTTNDEIGILIEGYEQRPMILENWHPPHYRELIEGNGFAKAMDLLMWELELGNLKQGERFDPSIHAAAEKALHDEGVAIRNISLRNLPDEMRAFSEVYNEAWGENWGFVPASDAEIEFHAKLLKQVLDEDWAYIAEKDGEPVGAALTLPDVNEALAKLNGRLLPFGWAKFLLARRKIDRLRVLALGVKRDYRHTGVAAGLYLKHLETAQKPGTIEGGEMGWILETNGPMNRAMEGMGGEVVKKYRVYEKSLSG
jgi:GNAT superfamily N-acetyltransferase